ncbi:asparagine synthase (glutamine-hydrolyzing) [Arhodomonas aquaeolei]|uniref:asparagine synthase (glutamine-hydrolyzing) n=1 Tax=Arhodomonas aquaeolei TaxID=2369 RepID=UPI00216A9DE5|nr:asparagine synthase (glutamine-hydrolyzing) [Arhodomonas aquaeolei]MCS4505799.1 asparagine synthase (glutamine-hydrolyzing) [Arhodomonas aquaeolei]
MCGIAGLLVPAQSLATAALTQRARGMAAALRHRGPDDSGVWVDADAGIALAHTRLAIQDLSPAGAQPMVSPGGRYRVVFNGEIYNFAALRRDLTAAGVSFRGGSDTEVLAAGVEHWGVEATLAKARGMFAVAVWDVRGRRLHLARDPLGEKPLYYGAVPGVGVLFGSELKALRAVPGMTTAIDRRALAGLLQYGYVPGPLSIHRGTYKLPPGVLLSLDCAHGPPDDVAPWGRRRGVRLTPFWRLADVAAAGVADSGADDEAGRIDGLDATLREVIGEQLVADVPVGAFLSAGLDSVTVTAIAQAITPRPLRTFTVAFDDPRYDESEAAAGIAAHLGTEHTTLAVTGRDALEVIPGLPRIYDEPFADPSQVPTCLIARRAREHVTVCLSGDGGDEIFAGYNRYLFAGSAAGLAARLPGPLGRLAGRGVLALPPQRWDRLAGAATTVLPPLRRLWRPRMGEKLHKLASVLDAGGPAMVYDALMSYWPRGTLPLRDAATPPPSWPPARLEGARALLDECMLWDGLRYLPDDNLVKVDRASMAVALETRVPLLDRRVVEYAWHLPLSMKVRDGRSKWILRRLLDRYVPPALMDRPKSGFSVPVDDWLRGPLRDWADALLAPERLAGEGLLDADAVSRRWREHLGGRRNHGLALWTVLMFEAWYEALPAALPVSAATTWQGGEAMACVER